jgi:hypothetical protein
MIHTQVRVFGQPATFGGLHNVIAYCSGPGGKSGRGGSVLKRPALRGDKIPGGERTGKKGERREAPGQKCHKLWHYFRVWPRRGLRITRHPRSGT